ncbi:hypothetical protein BST63_35520 [Bradyrhizobium canariense]|uniref:Uncharacterized protein n=1 Tax=Bradyrhizobium canariense TaxID=255045 RepID=A0ABX3WSU1_9BRAD|nr:hypothetical protein BSR47_31880 [Bradyrhizobium canariense]OSJ21041.1 hypothetical protein BST63_35520 [Bradyrhizobium canariense]
MQVPGCCINAGLLSVELFSHVKASIDDNPVARAPPAERRPAHPWPIVVVGRGLLFQKMFQEFRLRLFVNIPHVGGYASPFRVCLRARQSDR